MPEFIEVIFPAYMAPDDLDIITEASPDQPGLARLNKATVANDDALLSKPLFSRTGPKIGYLVDDETFVFPPFNSCYRLEAADATD